MTSEPPAHAASALNALASDPELLGDFILESREHLGAIELQLLALEHDPANPEAVHSIFRGFHSIKGLAGFLELGAVQEIAHEIETVLDRVRTFDLVVTPAAIEAILGAKDYLTAWLTHLERSQSTGELPEVPGHAALLSQIRMITQPTPKDNVFPALRELSEAVLGLPPAGRVEGRLVKVDTRKLDYLVDMVGEMVIAQSLVQNDPDLDVRTKPRLARSLSQLARITVEVQKTAMAMRMVPVGTLFRKMGRLVRDLSKRSGKNVELELIGEATELDRNIVEELGDPLLHMVRNAMDHGIELPEERQRAGKPATARIILTAGHQAGHIVIRISDDGRGLDRSRIISKAVRSGLIEEGASLSDREILNLIFLPGFSTSEQVTDISGRGVGMDVVRKNIEKLRGRVEIDSMPGQGATFLMKLPLTLAIVDGLVVSVGAERYVVPIHSVREMLRPREEAISTLEGRWEMALVRGELIPVIRLHRRFGIQPRSPHAWEGVLIVAEAAGKRFALLADDLAGKQEVVIKSLGPALQGIPGVAGGAILGDGRVGLILDLEGLIGGTK